MIVPLEKFLDWSAMQVVAMKTPTRTPVPNIEEAIQFLKSPDFISADSQPARLEFSDSLNFHFPTPRPCDFAENNVVPGRLYRCAERWQERPVVILLPGWNDSATYNLRFPRIAQSLNRAGINAATFVPPYHFQRRPRQCAEFGSGDFFFLARRTAQSVAEIRSLTGWLLNEGCPAVAIWGYSMGAHDAALTACHDARVDAVVLASVGGSFRPAFEQLAVSPRIRRRLEKAREHWEKMNLMPINLIQVRPIIPKEKILFVAGIYDLICAKEDVEILWQAWGQPEIWRLPKGHVSICCGFVPGLSGRVVRWLSTKL